MSEVEIVIQDWVREYRQEHPHRPLVTNDFYTLSTADKLAYLLHDLCLAHEVSQLTIRIVNSNADKCDFVSLERNGVQDLTDKFQAE
jgi:hypothetical protein